MGDRVALVLWVFQAFERAQELRTRIHQVHRDADVCKGIDDALRLCLAHERVVNEHGLELLPQRPVAQGRYHGAVHSAAQRIDGNAIAYNCLEFSNLLRDECSIAHGSTSC